MLVMLMTAAVSCVGILEDEQHNASVGGSSGTGGSNAGGSTGGASATGGSSTSGNSTGGSSTGGTGGCIDVCALYGPPCCVWSNACLEQGGSCVIDVLSGNGTTSGSYADLEQKIASLPPDALVSIRDVDIASAAADPPLAARIQRGALSELGAGAWPVN